VPAFSAATCAANGVLFLEPRKPQPPAVAQESVLPWRSVMVMIVLLKEACTCAIASSTFLRAFFGFLAAAAAAGSRLLGFLFSHFLVPQTLPGGAFNFTACLRGPFLVRALVRVR